LGILGICALGVLVRLSLFLAVATVLIRVIEGRQLVG
jgi:hypothetical protein